MAEGGTRLEPGSLFAGDYRVVRPLAEGGMGAVFVVEQLSTGKQRALKLMRPEVAQDAQSRQRFELEAKAGSRIESDHVVEIHSAGVDAGTPYIVMELLDGEDLATRMDRAGAFTPSDARDLFEQLCHAVAAAHAAGIIHRDLKPENVFLARKKRAGESARPDVKVLDFGIAKVVAETATRGATSGMIGTPMWMAPEQTDPGKITPAADVWALGLILYYVLTGRIYWMAASQESGTLTQLLKEVVMGPLPPASARAREQGVAGGIPPEVDAVFARCVVREPQRRFANAEELWAALGSALAPPSARILAGAPAGGLDATMPGKAGAPASGVAAVSQQPSDIAKGATVGVAPLPLPSYPQQPYSNVPPFRAVGLSHEKGMRASSYDRRLLLVLPAVGVLFLFMMFMRERSAAKLQREVDEEREDPGQSIVGGPLSKTSPPPKKAENPACRLCTSDVKVSGAVPKASVVPVLDAALPSIETQCLSARRRRSRGGTVVFSFVLRDGLAGNRKIERSSTADNTDECLLRSLADLRFPSSPEETNVTFTLVYSI